MSRDGRGISGSIDAVGRLQIKVRTKEGSELVVEVNSDSTVEELKRSIAERLHLVNKHIRLIASGRLLDPPSAVLSSFKLIDGSYVHAVITDATQHITASQGQTNPPPSSAPRIDMSNLRGMDTLMTMANRSSFLTQDEVTVLRSYFHEDIVEHARENMVRRDGESDVDFIYRCESEWMAAQGPTSEFRMNLYDRSAYGSSPSLLNMDRYGVLEAPSSGSGARALRASYTEDLNGTPPDQGTFRDFLYGLLMGFGCGYIMLFCMWDRNISQRQKLGILAGMVLSLMFSLVMQQGQGQSHGTAAGKLSQGSGNHQPSGSGNTVLPEIPIIDGGGLLPNSG